ncbi:MAG: hypothetical protein RL760_322 [Candidatus Eisenbacteria bacterium]|jgi:uncharacterized membrane protein
MASGPRIPFSGVLLVVFGSLFLADQLGALSFGHVFATWWPALLVLAGLLNLIERPGSPMGPILMIAVGAGLLLSNLHVIKFEQVFRLWPLVMIALGLNILFSSKNKG